MSEDEGAELVAIVQQRDKTLQSALQQIQLHRSQPDERPHSPSFMSPRGASTPPQPPPPNHEPGPLEALRQREWLLNMQEHQEIQCLEAAVNRRQAMEERQMSSASRRKTESSIGASEPLDAPAHPERGKTADCLKASPRSNSPQRHSPRRNSPRRNLPRRNSPRRNSPQKKPHRNKSPRKTSLTRTSPRRNSPRRNSPRRNSPRKNSPRRNSPRRNSRRRNSPKRDLPKGNLPRRRSPGRHSPRTNSPGRNFRRKNSPRNNFSSENLPSGNSHGKSSPRRSSFRRSSPRNSPRRGSLGRNSPTRNSSRGHSIERTRTSVVSPRSLPGSNSLKSSSPQKPSSLKPPGLEVDTPKLSTGSSGSKLSDRSSPGQEPESSCSQDKAASEKGSSPERRALLDKRTFPDRKSFPETRTFPGRSTSPGRRASFESRSSRDFSPESLSSFRSSSVAHQRGAALGPRRPRRAGPRRPTFWTPETVVAHSLEPLDVNVWEERQHRGQPLCGPAPITPEDESAMLARALEQSCLDSPPTRQFPEDEEEQLLQVIERSKRDVGPSAATCPSPVPEEPPPTSAVPSPLPGGCSPASECTSASSGGSSHGSGAFPWTSHQRKDHWQHRASYSRTPRAYHHDGRGQRNFGPATWHGQNGPRHRAGWYDGQQRNSWDDRDSKEDRHGPNQQYEPEENWKEKMLGRRPGSQSRTLACQQGSQGTFHQEEQCGYSMPDRNPLAAHRARSGASSPSHSRTIAPSASCDGLQDLPDMVTVVGTIDARNLMRSKVDGEPGDPSGAPRKEENADMSFDQWLSLCGKYMPLLTRGMMEVQKSCVAVQNMGMNGALYAAPDGTPVPFMPHSLRAPHMVDLSQAPSSAQVMTAFHYDQSRVALVRAPTWGTSECVPYLPGAEFRLSCPPPPLPSPPFVTGGFPLQQQPQQLHSPAVSSSTLNPQAQPFQPPVPPLPSRRGGSQPQQLQRPHGLGPSGRGPSSHGRGRGRFDLPHHGRPRR